MFSRKLTIFIGSLFYLLTATSVSAALYDLPFKGENLKPNEKISWGALEHGTGGVQKYGYDLGAMRYDSSAKKWTRWTIR